MPQVRNFYYRSIKCPLCQKEIDADDERWFCSKECEDEWKKINGDLRESKHKNIKGQDTSA